MIEIFDCAQGTPEWFQIRAGIPTCSEFDKIVKKDGTRRTGDMPRTYMMELAGEILTEEPKPNFSTAATNMGHELEPKARELYAFIKGCSLREVGFVRNGSMGYSPDSLIGETGALEIKCKAPKGVVACIYNDEFPDDHKAQCQGGLLVSEREYIDIAVYWPSLPLFTKRAYRDDAYLKNLEASIKSFNEDLSEVVEKVRSYGEAA